MLRLPASVSASTVGRIWRPPGRKPHGVHTFKLSNDPRCAATLDDIVRLYLPPPEHALVLSRAEKSQIQALDRSQPGQTMTHDYQRNRTTTLLAALHTLDGSVIGTCLPRHTPKEWLRFLRLIVDNYSPHKHAEVKRWLRRHQRFHLYFTPPSAS